MISELEQAKVKLGNLEKQLRIAKQEYKPKAQRLAELINTGNYTPSEDEQKIDLLRMAVERQSALVNKVQMEVIRKEREKLEAEMELAKKELANNVLLFLDRQKTNHPTIVASLRGVIHQWEKLPAQPFGYTIF